MPEYLPGSVRSLELTNFMTYRHVVVTPGPRLNLVIGPNGAGKSSILIAISLGLGGSPRKSTGREQKLEDFVTRSEEAHECIIKVTLHVDKDDPSYRKSGFPEIERRFRKGCGDTSTWKLNGKSTTKTKIDRLVRKYGIQLDNLCQVMPQETVGNFTKFTPQQLLEKTLLACRGQWTVTEFK